MSESFITSRISWNTHSGGTLSSPLKSELPVTLNGNNYSNSGAWSVNELILGAMNLEMATMLRATLNLSKVELELIELKTTAKLPARGLSKAIDVLVNLTVKPASNEQNIDWPRIFNTVEENGILLNGMKSQLNIKWTLNSKH